MIRTVFRGARAPSNQWGRSERLVLVVGLTVSFGLAQAVPVHAATTWKVPADFTTIQAAIDAATDGDTINVYPGTYNQDEANNRDPLTGGVGSNDFNIFVNKALTIQGVTAGGVPITDYHNVAAFVIAERNVPDFGCDAIFVQADNVTITGLDITGFNAPAGNNKTVEVTGDDFTLKYSRVHALDQTASVYVDDTHYDAGTDTSHVQSYRIEANLIDGGGPDAAGIYLDSGAGWSGPISGRVITGNTISNCIDGISFVGPGGNPWDLYPVGAATITGNTFASNDRRQVIAWGTYNAGLGYAALDWNAILSSNTFDKAVTVWTPASALRTWNTGAFTNIVGIYSAIQRYPINRVAQAGDTIDVAAGTYAEQVSIAMNNITVNGSTTGGGSLVQPTTVVSDTTQGSPCSNGTGTAIVLVSGVTGVTLNNLNVDGSLITTGPDRFIGIYYRNASGAINGGSVTGIRNGQQNANAIVVQANGANVAAVNTTGVTVSNYEKNGITYNGCGCSDSIDGVATGTVSGCTITGDGPIGTLAQNGVQVGFGAGHVTITSNDISANYYTGDTSNGNGADGILFFSSSNNTATGNVIDGNNNGIENVNNQFDLCVTGESTGNSATCNRITHNDVGVLSYSPVNAQSNEIKENTLGADGTSIATGTLDATNSWWGCIGGPGGSCNAVTSGVTVIPFATSVPTCVGCTSEPDGAPCNSGDVCQAGVCTGYNTLSLATVRLVRNYARSATRPNGAARVYAIVNDADTGGGLVTDLQSSGGVTLDVQDGAEFSVTITLKNCTVNTKTGKVTCKKDASNAAATFTKLRRYPGTHGSDYGVLYRMRVRRTKLGTSETGSAQPTGPVQVILHQTLVDRSEGMGTSEGSTCTKSGKNALVCRGG